MSNAVSGVKLWFKAGWKNKETFCPFKQTFERALDQVVFQAQFVLQAHYTQV